MPKRFCLNLPCFPLIISARDLRGLLLEPVMALPRLPLSNKASTDSCNILFSFLTMISGALSSINLFNLLFRLITLLYKSFKSEVANLPPSRGTRGLRSGGKTGKTSNIIHSGLLLEFINALSILRRLASFFFFASLFVEAICSSTSITSCSRFISERRIFTDSAPIPAENSSPNSSSFSKYSSSSKI